MVQGVASARRCSNAIASECLYNSANKKTDFVAKIYRNLHLEEPKHEYLHYKWESSQFCHLYTTCNFTTAGMSSGNQ